MNYNKWLNHDFSTGCTVGKDYVQFQKAMRADLESNISNYGMEINSFQKGHYDFSAVIEKEGKFIYISIADVRYFKNEWFTDVLYRTMKHDKDWTGGVNRRCSWQDLPDCLNRLFAVKNAV